MTLEQRIANLEHQNRRWRAIAIATIMIATLGVTMGSSAQNCGTVVAQRFVLVDQCGNQRGEWTLNQNEPSIAMYGSNPNKNKQSIALLGVSPLNQKPAQLILNGNNRSTRVIVESAESYSSAAVWGFGDTSRYAQIITGPNASSELQLTYGNLVRVNAIADQSESQVLVRASGGQEKSLKVP